jgi:mRNA-degrading endonuclease toxin of MazEF toxin-antitoxin module
MSALCHGQIVWVEIPDSQGRNPKDRLAVVILSSDASPSDAEVWVVGISTDIGAARSSDQVFLPWDAQGHPTTGLRQECSAVCTWMHKVPVTKIRRTAGMVRGRQLIEIMRKIGELPPAP